MMSILESQTDALQAKTSTAKLFDPLNIGALALKHGIVMAPLTRMRSSQPGAVPNDMMDEYYGQRASEGGLIITEATLVSDTANGYLGAPGIYSDEQEAGWRKIVDTIHSKGGLAVLQLWHVGRVSHVDLNNGATPVAPSVVPFNGVVFTQNGWVPASPHRELTVEEIPSIVEYYRSASQHAKNAGFDGVEIHAANGYLLDQFLQDGSNKRTDAYGGSPENRARLLFDVLDGVLTVWDSNRIGIRLSPSTTFNEMFDSDPDATFGYVAEHLNAYDIAYLHIIEPRVKGNQVVNEGQAPVASEKLRKIFKNAIIAAGGFELDSAREIVEKGDANAVAFGRHFISNPDLPARLKQGLPLTPYDRDTFYAGTSKGYTDYPFFKHALTSVT